METSFFSRNKGWIIGLGIVVLIAMYGFVTYNGLVKTSLAADTQWAQVETQYQRRFDLIPGLVNSVQGVMKQEKDVFGAIADARSRYAGATTPDAKASAATGMESALARLLVVMENYPQLKSSDVVQTFMSQLEGTENRISVERMRFNETVQIYNLKVSTFPSALVAKVTGFSVRSMFKAATGAEIAPKVDFTK